MVGGVRKEWLFLTGRFNDLKTGGSPAVNGDVTILHLVCAFAQIYIRILFSQLMCHDTYMDRCSVCICIVGYLTQ